MKLRRHARVWQWSAVIVFVGISVWQWGPASLAIRRTTAQPQVAAADFGRWSSIGPTHLIPSGNPNAWTGRVTSVAVDPADSNHWLVGAAMGGVWDTPDAGATWIPRTDGQPSLAMGAIAFSQASPNVVYAGTGEANFGRWNYAGAGIMRSADSGVTWSVVNTDRFARASVKALLVHPTDANIVLAGTARGYAGRDLRDVRSPPVVGVQRSTDGGQTWTRVLTGQITALVRNPGDFNLQYAAVGEPGATGLPASNPDGTMVNGVYRTTDMGEHWTPVPGPWTSSDGAAFAAGYIALAVAPSNPDVVYASVQSPGGLNNALLGLFRTNNAWAATPEWTRISIDAVRAQSLVGYCNQCSYAHTISVDPSDPDTLFAGGNWVWRCRSCPTRPAWVQVAGDGAGPQGDMHVDQHAFTWSGNRLIVANDGGVFSSVDRGATWRPHNSNLSIVQFYGGAVHPTRPNFILGNTQDNLLVRWTGAGAWERMASSLNFAEGEVVISTSRPDTDWATNYLYSAVGRTTDGGRTFQEVQGSISNRAPYPDLAIRPTLRKCPGNDDVMFYGANSLWRTDNFFSAPAPTWSVNAPDIDVRALGCAQFGRIPAACAVILAIAFADSDASCKAYAFGTGGGFLRITNNGGASWSDFDPRDGVPDRAVTGLAFAPSDPNIAYLTLSGVDEGPPGWPASSARPGHVFKSMNALASSPTWTNVSPPVNIPFNVIAIDPTTANTVFAGADNGVWASRDGGATWAYMGPDSGLPNTAVFDLQIQSSTGKLFAFTHGRGAFVLTPSP